MSGISSASVDVVFFDATGTLIHLPRGVGWHYADVSARFGVRAAPESLDAAFHQVWKRLPPPAMTGGPRADDDKGWWRRLVREVTAEAGAEFSQFDAFFESLYSRFAEPGVWALYPEVEAVLDELCDRFRLAVISNFDGRLRAVLEALGVAGRFERLIISSEVGADKPAREIFDAACAQMGVVCGRALHTGDHPVHDWEGAENAGLHVYKLDRTWNSLRGLAAALRG